MLEIGPKKPIQRNLYMKIWLSQAIYSVYGNRKNQKHTG